MLKGTDETIPLNNGLIIWIMILSVVFKSLAFGDWKIRNRQAKVHDQFQGNGEKHYLYLSWLRDSQYERKFICVQQHEF